MGEPSVEMERILSNFLESKGITTDKDSLEHKQLLREISRVHLETLRIDESRDLGDFSDSYYLPEETPAVSVVLKAEAPLVSSPASTPLVLSTLIELYVAEKIAKGRWTPKTKHEVTACLGVFLKILGDVDVKTLSRRTLVDCLNEVSSLKVKGKPIAARTVKKHITHMSSLLKWGAMNSYLDRNPAGSLSPTINKAPSEERSIYSPEDLNKLVVGLKKNKAKDKDKPERYWIPLIGLYAGMRLNEMCQLYKEDVKQLDGVWCFDVNREKDKKLKNNTSIRIVPIHSKLIALGFLEYKDSVKHERLWPNLRNGRDGYASLYGKWYQRFNRDCITKDEKKVFHSLRHNFTDGLKQAGVSKEVAQELLGHSDGSVTFDRYGKKFNPRLLAETVEQLKYNLDI